MALAALLVAACGDGGQGGPDDLPDAKSDTSPFADILGDGLGDNDPPGPVEIAITPAEPTAGDDLVVEITVPAIDPDGGPDEVTYRYAWFRDDQPTPHGAATLPAAVIKRDEVWRVEVHAFDGLATGPKATAEVTIANTPPTLASVTAGPANATTDSVLTCLAGNRSDADGDDVSVDYVWTKDGVLIDGETQAALQIPLTANAEYRCWGTPFDGALHGAQVPSNAVVPVDVILSKGLLLVQPKALDMGTVLPGETSTRVVVLKNIGDGAIELNGVGFSGDLGLSTDFETPATLEPGAQVEATITFSTGSPGLKKGTVIFDNTASNSNAGTVPWVGVGAAPCLTAAPAVVDFGGAYLNTFKNQPVTITSCGALPLVIDSATLVAPAGTPFELDLSTGPGPLPWTLQAGESATIGVKFMPSKASPVDEDGLPLSETAQISFLTNAPNPVFNVPVTGFASDVSCPIPVIDIAEGKATAPNSTVHASGLPSFSPEGTPDVFAWAIVTPDGTSPGPLQPGADAPEVTYQVAGPGNYRFDLKVFDLVDGVVKPSCTTAQKTIKVSTATPLVVELTWQTPGDTNTTDKGPGASADLDLHLLRHDLPWIGTDYDGDGQPDGWFDFDADLYWVDTNPDWGAPGPEGDPLLTKEDGEGKGPERIEHFKPEAGSYTIGVHYWSDFGYGPSIVRVRVLHYGEVVGDFKDVVLSHGDLWEVATVAWPKGAVQAAVGAEGGPKVTPAYPNPFQ